MHGRNEKKYIIEVITQIAKIYGVCAFNREVPERPEMAALSIFVLELR